MAVCELHLNQTNCLQKMVSLTAIIPEGFEGPFPVFYLLHGLSDDHTAWVRRTAIERFVQNVPMIVIMPDGSRNFYCDAVDRPYSKYETFMVSDLIEFVDATFRTICSREARAIGGLSMGGYGAVKLALKYPELYGAAVSYSGALDMCGKIDRLGWAKAPDGERYGNFGSDCAGGPNDILTLIEAIDPKKAPAISIDCGTEDGLVTDTRLVHEALTKRGIAHVYGEYSGGHTWEYWTQSLLRTLPWIVEKLGIPAEIEFPKI